MEDKIKAYTSILELIGNTPLVKLNRITENLKGNFYAKLEAFNPGHSSKDRIAAYIIEEAERKGIFVRGQYHHRDYFGQYGFQSCHGKYHKRL